MIKSNTASLMYIDFSNDTITEKYLMGKFVHVHSCKSCKTASQINDECDLDLIIINEVTNEALTLLNTLTLKCPVIVVSSIIESNYIISLVNSGCTKFITKPINLELFNKCIASALETQLYQREEVQHLREISEYYDFHQELTHLKEKHAMQNDFNQQYVRVQHKDRIETWILNLVHLPHEIVSGDAYSQLDLGDYKSFCFIVDAMGKGVAASVTSILTTTFINYLVVERKVHDFEKIVGYFLHYISRILLPEEVLSATLLYIDLKNEYMKYSSFGMPKFYIHKGDTVTSYKSNNMPITRYIKDYEIGQLDLQGIDKILVYSDGMTDALCKDSTFSDYVEEVFKTSLSMATFQSRFFGMSTTVDDVTILVITRHNRDYVLWDKTLTCKSTMADITDISAQVSSLLTTVPEISDSTRTDIEVAFSEAIMNSFEHGNLGLDLMSKHNALSNGNYEELIQKLEKEHGYKEIRVHLEYHKYGMDRLFLISIWDKGSQLNRLSVDKTQLLLCGRGIDIISCSVDHIYYSTGGENIVMVKVLKEK